MAPLNRPKTFEFLDYRQFLAAFFQFRKEQDSEFSLRTFSRHPELKLSSSSFISAILKGRKNLSQKLRLCFTRALELSPDETDYFEWLVQFNQSVSAEERERYLALLNRFHPTKSKALSDSQARFFSHWHYAVLWNFFAVHPDWNNPVLIGKSLRPELSGSEVEGAIRALLDMKLIKRLANGYAVIDRHLVPGKGFRGSAALQYAKGFLRRASDSLEEGDSGERQNIFLFCSLSPEGRKRVQQRMEIFRAEIHEIVDQDSGQDGVYALGVQLFPCTQAQTGPDPALVEDGKTLRTGTWSEILFPELKHFPLPVFPATP